MSRCIGCGIPLQFSDDSKPGYVKEIVTIENGENIYCKRCYDIIHHNFQYSVENDLNKYYDKISKIKDEKALVLLIVDVMDLYGGFIPKIDECIGNNETIIIVNKTDVLPKDLKVNFIEKIVLEIVKKTSLKVNSILIGSVKNNDFVKRIVNKIENLKYRTNRKTKYHHPKSFFDNCYLIGHASVGKSTLMNQIGKLYLGYQNDVITTSAQYNTTIDLIKWPLDQNSFIIDTPGIVNYRNYGYYLDNKSITILTPKKYLKPRVFQLNDGQTIFLGGLVRIDFIASKPFSACFYVANTLYLHRTKTIKADKIFEEQAMKLLVPPFSQSEKEKIGDFDILEDKIEQVGLLFISGIGFIRLIGDNLLIKVHIPRKIKVEMVKDV